MSNKDLISLDEETEGLDWRTRILITGGVVGLLVGLGAAMVYIRQLEESGENPKITVGDSMAVGLGLLGLVNQVGNMGKKKKR